LTDSVPLTRSLNAPCQTSAEKRQEDRSCVEWLAGSPVVSSQDTSRHYVGDQITASVATYHAAENDIEYITYAQWRIVVNALDFGPRGSGFASRPCRYSTMGSNLGQVVYSHCLLPSLLISKKLGYKRKYSDWTDFTA